MNSRARLAPLTGLAFFPSSTLVVFMAFGEPPDADVPAQEIVDFYVDVGFVAFIASGFLVAAIRALTMRVSGQR
jgi:hypothetical protein